MTLLSLNRFYLLIIKYFITYWFLVHWLEPEEQYFYAWSHSVQFPLGARTANTNTTYYIINTIKHKNSSPMTRANLKPNSVSHSQNIPVFRSLCCSLPCTLYAFDIIILSHRWSFQFYLRISIILDRWWLLNSSSMTLSQHNNKPHAKSNRSWLNSHKKDHIFLYW